MASAKPAESERVALDEVDRRIVAELRADGRMSVNQLARRARVSRTTAYTRLQRLRDEGVITGFAALVDPEKLGLDVTALILANVEQSQWRLVQEEIRDLPGLEYLAFTSGEFDVAMLVRVPDMKTLRDVVLERLHGATHVRDSRTIFVLDDHLNPGGSLIG